MLATLGGLLALLLGLLLLLLPLLVGELSRPRDSFWGAVVLLLGLVLVTSSDRLVGAPMLGVLCGGLLIGRLGLEVGQGRWRQLTPEERQRLATAERWSTGFGQLAASGAGLTRQLTGALAGLGGSLDKLRPKPGAAATPVAAGRSGRHKGKRWVRPEPAGSAEPTGDNAAGAEDATLPAPAAETSETSGSAVAPAEAPEQATAAEAASTAQEIPGDPEASDDQEASSDPEASGDPAGAP